MRRELDMVSSVIEQIYFVDSTGTISLHLDDGPVAPPVCQAGRTGQLVRVRSACGTSQENLLLKTCFQR